jgi:hypothetical protein
MAALTLWLDAEEGFQLPYLPILSVGNGNALDSQTCSASEPACPVEMY